MSVTHHSLIIIVIFSCVLCASSNEETDEGSGSDVSTNNNDSTKYFEINCTSDCRAASYMLSEIAENFSDPQSKIIIYVYVKKLQLTRSGHFRNLKSVVLFGNNHTFVCDKDQGISFMSVGKVKIRNLSIKECGSQRSRKDVRYISALHILFCGQVELLNVTVTKGSGVNIFRPTENVTITDSYFTNNKLADSSSLREPTQIGGNGLRLIIFDKTKGNASQYVRIERCHFTQNLENGRDYSFLYGNLVGRGRGGGMLIIIDTTIQKIIFNICLCEFEENNAFLGSGLSLSLRGDGSIQNIVRISQTRFTRNGCNDSSMLGVGGGALISFENRNYYDQHLSEVHFNNVTIEMNCAALGGGLSFFSSKYVKGTTGQLAFENCTWTKNRAHIGSALMLTPNVFVRAIVGHLPVPHFNNCTFQENSIETWHHDYKKYGHDTLKQFGSGTIYSSFFSMKFIDEVHFINNFGSGITVISGEINLNYSNAEFYNNTAVQGGALALIGVSTIVIGANKTYKFENNSAYDRGGAIFVQLVDNVEIVTSRSCFINYIRQSKHPIQSSFWNSSLFFKNNRAKKAGHSIFATSLLPCQVVGNDSNRRYKILNISEIFQEPGIVIESKITEKQISTEGTEFASINSHLIIAPGLQQELNFSILDDLGQPVDTNIAAILPTTSRLNVTSIYSNGSQYKVKLNGREGDNDTLTLQTLGTIQLRYKLIVSLQKCPTGFRLHDHYSCECDFESYVGITKCEKNAAYLTGGFWAGQITTGDNRKILATSICPVGFCTSKNSNTSSKDVRLPTRLEDLEEAICDVSRRGILCGTCNEGYTAYYHSPLLSCLKEEPFSCNLGWLFYILSEIIPVTLVFGLVLAFNINLTSGTLNGFILFSQLQRTLYFDASGIITFGPITQQLTLVYQVIYGFFNLDFFNIEPLAYCLWKNATVLDMICFKYLTVIYSFFLVTSVIFFMRYCAARCLGRYYSVSVLRNSVIHGISGFLVLCYTQTITVSFYLLYSYTLFISSNEKSPVNNLTRVYFSGDHESFGKGHLPYAVPAVAALLTVGCIPPVILLCYPQLNKVLAYLKWNQLWGLRSFEHLNKLKPLLHSFQGSFKDKYRFFAGLYFFYRWVGLIAYTYWSSFSGFYLTVQVTVTMMLVLHSICQPYQKWQHNVLDTFIFAIILIINGFSNLNYYLVRVDSGINSNSTQILALQLFFIYLPLVYLLMYILTWAFRRVQGGPEQHNPQEFILTKLRKRINHPSLSESKEPEDNELPYRLLEHRDDQAFTETETICDELNLDTY